VNGNTINTNDTKHEKKNAFDLTQESNDHITFLDLTIIRGISKLEIDFHHKPTTTHTAIHFSSNHPNEHKLAACRYYIEKMLNLPLNAERQKREWLTILHIAQRNKYPPKILHKMRRQIQHKTKHTTPPTNMNNSKKLATFTFISPHIRRITYLFRNTSVKVMSLHCRKTYQTSIGPQSSTQQMGNLSTNV